MPATIEIKRTSDGAVAVHQEPEDWLGTSLDFMWLDGNYSCDCNRFLFFERALGRDPALADAECGRGAYLIRVTDPAGSELHKDEGFDMAVSAAQ